VTLIGGAWRPADLTVIGSHCVGLDMLLGRMQSAGFATKLLAVGSTAGLHAARAGRCDLAGVHLLNPATGRYNDHLVDDHVALLPGYTRVQGLVFRPDDERFVGDNAREVIARVRDDPACRMIGRNAGSGTRALIDRLLDGRQPPGYAIQPSSHNAVAAAVAQRRADWGVAVEWVARQPLPGFPDGLAFLPIEEEHYDWLVPRARLDRPAVAAFRRLLDQDGVRDRLARMGLLRKA